MIELVIAVLAGLLILSQVERYLYAKHMNEELQKCMNRVMSRNVGEYIAVAQKDAPKNDKAVEHDEVFESEASDEDFAKHIQRVTQ